MRSGVPCASEPAPEPTDAELVERICADIATGTLVKDACKTHGIGRTKLHSLVTGDPTLANRYARAREDQAHAIAEEAVTIADSANAVDAAAKRLMVDTRKWLASKIAPRNYGERQLVETRDLTLEDIIREAAQPTTAPSES